ncbi:hypothetical protein GCM10023334_117410 [Nonomuraea thailandensis]
MSFPLTGARAAATVTGVTETFVMRPATAADRPAVTRMIHARCQWMEERGLPSWRASVDELVGQCENPDGDVWILEGAEHGVAGQMVVQDQGPPWGWTDEERAEAALYLSGSITDPALRSRKPGTLMAWWAVDRAAQLGVQWVRRHCHFPQVASYNLTQGLTASMPSGPAALFGCSNSAFCASRMSS